MKVPCSFWKLVGAELSVSEGLKPGFMTSLIVRLAVIFLVNVKRQILSDSNKYYSYLNLTITHQVYLGPLFAPHSIQSVLSFLFLKLNNYTVKEVALMREPTTVNQYKEFCKALKLKILKQKATIESQAQQIQKLNTQLKLSKRQGLQQRNENESSRLPFVNTQGEKNKSPVDGADLETLDGKNRIMNKFKKGTCSFGITPESIFRIADFAYKNEVQVDYFRQVLSKIDLGLTPREISCLIYIFDENCTGLIHRDDYHDSLNAFQISLQESYLQYTSCCLQKLAKIFESDRIEVLKFFQEMEGKTPNSVDLNKFSEKIKAVFGKRLQIREIMGAFNAIDLQTDGIICKKNFVYSVTSAINKMSNQSVAKKTNSFDEQQNQFHRSTLSNKKSTANNNSILTDNIHEAKPPIEGDQPLSDIVAKIQAISKISLRQIYEEICRTPLEKRLTLLQFRKIVNEIQGGEKIEPEHCSQLFRAMDVNHKGSIFLSELIQFYLAHQTDMSIIFHLIGIYFKNNDLSAERFWFLFGVTPDSDISKTKFIEVMGKSFSSSINNAWEKIWGYFDKGRGVASVASINKELAKYQISQ